MACSTKVTVFFLFCFFYKPGVSMYNSTRKQLENTVLLYLIFASNYAQFPVAEDKCDGVSRSTDALQRVYLLILGREITSFKAYRNQIKCNVTKSKKSALYAILG